MFDAVTSSPFSVVSFRECCECAASVQKRAAEQIRTPSGTSVGFEVTCALPLPGGYDIRRHFFSVLFQSVYHVLGVSKERRALFCSLNYLFRIWVTSADNLLDDEDKVTLEIRMPGSSRVMRQVVAIMAADRIAAELLGDAMQSGVITQAQSRLLLHDSLTVLLPSAAQEASEEGGIEERPDPEYVLSTIHRLKTGLLFNLPFAGLEVCDDAQIDLRQKNLCKDALMSFGLGCQLLDDIRDIARDAQQHRHNYVLSSITHTCSTYAAALESVASGDDPDTAVFMRFPEAVIPTAKRAKALMTDGLTAYISAGFDLPLSAVASLVEDMFVVLGVAELVPYVG